MDEEPPEDEETSNVLVFRNHVGDPIAVPSHIVTEAERAYRCYEMRIVGFSWDEIAEQEQYPSAVAAAADVKRYVEEGRALVTERSQRQMLALEVARLDALQVMLWPKAKAGNMMATETIRKIIMSRVQITGTDASKAVDEVTSEGRTVVLTAAETEDDGFIARMRDAANRASRR